MVSAIWPVKAAVPPGDARVVEGKNPPQGHRDTENINALK
jgi:hypothetical protein